MSADVGLPTLKDIVAELAKPGRDPRSKFEAFSFDEAVNKPEDLKLGMRLPGIVTNVTAFGAFVDVGVHQDGLVHVSQIADTFVKDPSEHVKPGQKVQVTVTDLDLARNRIALSMRTNPELGGKSGGSSSGGERRSPGGPRRDGGGGGGDRRGGGGHSGGNRSSGSGGGSSFGTSLGGDWFNAALKKKK